MKKLVPFGVALLVLSSSCKTLKSGWDNLNLFPVSQDVELGKQVHLEIAGNQTEFPELPEKGNEVVYSYVRNIVQKILKGGNVEYANDFVWDVTLINDLKTLNAFATPGGYIYIYTGLINFLDSEDQLAGVIGHELAHSAKRHSTKQLSKSLGIQILADAALGKQEMIKQVATALLTLSFSRAHETQADSMSVVYLCPTNYHAAGASGFFKKMENQPAPPAWLSTHPNSKDRVQNIESKNKQMACAGTQTYSNEYAKIKELVAKIPPAKKSDVKTLPKDQGTPNPQDKTNTPKPANDSDKRQKKLEKPGGGL
ncbi:MAG: M48 family metalloprotease [Saprospiraceae bacterium]|nr:M48 family metalloprotease [Saprospiraceae bacterium]